MAYRKLGRDSLVTRPDTKEAWQRYVQDPDRQKRVCKVAANYVINKLESWRESPDQVEQMNRQALAFAARELKRLQVWFGKTAEQEILKYDGNYLAEQLENGYRYLDMRLVLDGKGDKQTLILKHNFSKCKKSGWIFSKALSLEAVLSDVYAHLIDRRLEFLSQYKDDIVFSEKKRFIYIIKLL